MVQLLPAQCVHYMCGRACMHRTYGNILLRMNMRPSYTISSNPPRDWTIHTVHDIFRRSFFSLWKEESRFCLTVGVCGDFMGGGSQALFALNCRTFSFIPPLVPLSYFLWPKGSKTLYDRLDALLIKGRSKKTTLWDSASLEVLLDHDGDGS